MNNREFIPGLWEEEINVTDFLNLNKRPFNGHASIAEHTLNIEPLYDVIKDKNKVFKYLVPFVKDYDLMYNEKRVLYLEEEKYTQYIDTSDRKKFLDIGLLKSAKKEERWAFIQPELCIVPLYGTKTLVKALKQYLKDLDKQLKTEEWRNRKVSNHRSIEAIHNFEEFSLSHGVNVRKPCSSSIDAANVLWVTTLYAILENPEVSFSFYSMIPFLDIFIERDIKQGLIDETIAQRLIDEFYCKLSGLRLISRTIEDFDYSITIASSQICKTTYRVVNSSLFYEHHKIPFQMIFNSEPFPEDLLNNFDELFKKGHPFAVSQSFRKRNAKNLSLTSSHTFFRTYEDVTMFFASFDLKEALLVALNGGKDVKTNSNVQKIKGQLQGDSIDFENAFIQLEAYLNYYVTLYTEYINAFSYYYDLYHDLPFRQSMISTYPFYLMNIAYHNVSPVINILTAIYLNEYQIKRNSKGFIQDILTLTPKREEFIGTKLNQLIHEETSRMLFHKNGHYNLLFFAEKPFFEEEDKLDIQSLSPDSFLKTSFSGFQKIGENDFKQFLVEFKNTSYTHIRIHKK